MSFLLLNFIIALLVTALTSFLVGVFILLKSWKNKTNRIFGFYSLAISLWTFFQGFANLVEKSEWSIYFSKAIIVGGWLTPSLFIHFVISLLNIKNRKWVVRIAYALSAIFIYLSIFTNQIIVGVAPKFFIKNFVIQGPLYKFGMYFLIICVIYGLSLLFKELVTTKDLIRRNQIKYLVWPSLMGYLGGGSIFLLVFNIYIPVLNPFGIYFIALYVVSVSYAILRYRLLDINIVIKKALIYSIIIALISGLITAISFLNDRLTENIPWFRSWTMPMLAGFVSFFVGRLFWMKSKEVEKMKYEFITVATHKLRTPLTKVKWGLESLKTKGLKEIEKDRLLLEINKANEETIALTDELLTVSKAEAGQYQYRIEPVQLGEIAEEAIKLFKHEIDRKKIKLSTDIKKDLPRVNVDKERISSVIKTLLENAILYTKNEISIKVSREADSVLFSIKDNGIGIKKEDRDFIFSKFYRTHGAYLAETEGTGIGLFIAKNIIKKHGGKIGVKSDGEGKGSEFWFKLFN